jgi:hypothetical protein
VKIHQEKKEASHPWPPIHQDAGNHQQHQVLCLILVAKAQDNDNAEEDAAANDDAGFNTWR